jgi:hypothetical protein
MRSILPLAILLISCATASGQTQMPFVLEHRADAPRDARYYPQRAHDDGVPGIVVLCCKPNDDRTLACSALQEAPSGQGFAEAAIRAVQDQSLVTAASFAAYRSAENKTSARIVFRFDGASGRYPPADAHAICPAS